MKKIIYLVPLLVGSILVGIKAISAKDKEGKNEEDDTDVLENEAPDKDENLNGTVKGDALIKQQINFLLSNESEINSIASKSKYGSDFTKKDQSQTASDKPGLIAELLIQANSAFQNGIPIDAGGEGVINFVNAAIDKAANLKNSGSENDLKALCNVKSVINSKEVRIFDFDTIKPLICGKNEMGLCAPFGQKRSQSKIRHRKAVGRRIHVLMRYLEGEDAKLKRTIEIEVINILKRKGYNYV